MKPTVKSIKTRLKDLQIELEIETEKIKTAQKRSGELKSKIINLETQLESLTAELSVSEHAIIRYIERVIGISRDEIIAKILTDDVRNMHMQLGSGKFPLGDTGARAVIKNNTVVTIEE